MRLWTPTIRLVALIVLLTSVSDYWAYDRWDCTAPMNSPGPETMAVIALQKVQTVSLRGASLPDDHCLCCSPLMARSAPVLPLPCLSSLLQNVVASIELTPLRGIDLSGSVPLRDPTGFDRPLRV
jgi:hypothetical protein